jgi:quercetin dioxygenase-like cupin family protein
MLSVLLKRFEKPDETRTFEKGKFEVINIGKATIGRASYDPGWKWSKHNAPTAGTPRCEVEHVGMVISGRSMVLMNDGGQFELKPGDLFHVSAGHDSWVIGDQPYVSLHFMGAGQYAK